MSEELDAEVTLRGPAEWAFAELLKIAAFGLAVPEHRHELRERTLMARSLYRARNNSCQGCGHARHEPEGTSTLQDCETCRVLWNKLHHHCSAWRDEDGSLRYAH